MKTIPVDAIIREVWYIYCAMKRISSGSYLVCLVFGIMLFVVVLPATAETSIQPSLRLVFSRNTSDLGEDASEARRILLAAIESKFAAQRRYRIERETTDATPEEYVASTGLGSIDVVVFVRIASRLDGSLKSDVDVYSDGSFVRSGEDELPVGEDRFVIVDQISDELSDAVASLFPGFGRIRFTNTGYPHNYYVRANGVDIGANIREIDLPVGTYDIEIRRRDDVFSRTVGHRQVEVNRDGFYELVFVMDRAAPPTPRYFRLMNPDDRWNAIYMIRGATVTPIDGFDELSIDEAWSVMGTTLFGGIPFEGATVGIETGYLRFAGEPDDGDDESGTETSITVNVTPLLGTIGLTTGPVSGIDFILRGSAGIAIYGITVEETDGDIELSDERTSDIDPAFGGVVEFGFGVGKNRRLSIEAGLFGIITGGQIARWAQFGVGLGGRF
ncbi:MAG: hypothetical protein ACLFR8_10085 [Alkalispirochaeta sp.]